MKQKETIFIDLDGSCYPSSQLSMADMVNAVMEEICASLSPKEAKGVSELCINKGHLGVFNYLFAAQKLEPESFEDACKNVVERIDYGRVLPNPLLLKQINSLKERFDVYVFTNNVRPHVEKVFQRLFNMSIEETGIVCFDIVSTYQDGRFHPKQTDGLDVLCKQLKINPKTCLLIDDTQKNLDAAKKFGLKTILLKDNDDIVKKLKALL